MSNTPPQAPCFPMEPIGWMRCDLEERYQAHHQGPLARGVEGVIELRAGFDYEQALLGLEGFERVWIVFVFHLNATPDRTPVMIRPPRHERSVGVFSTRSPHRPNAIGMSCVRLLGVEQRAVRVADIDILDGSPILDIKPYLPEWDAFPDARTGWVQPRRRFEVTLEPPARLAAAEIASTTGQRLDRYAAVQLQLEPMDTGRKRIRALPDGTLELSYQRFRLIYRIDLDAAAVTVTHIHQVGAAP